MSAWVGKVKSIVRRGLTRPRLPLDGRVGGAQQQADVDTRPTKQTQSVLPGSQADSVTKPQNASNGEIAAGWVSRGTKFVSDKTNSMAAQARAASNSSGVKDKTYKLGKAASAQVSSVAMQLKLQAAGVAKSTFEPVQQKAHSLKDAASTKAANAAAHLKLQASNATSQAVSRLKQNVSAVPKAAEEAVNKAKQGAYESTRQVADSAKQGMRRGLPNVGNVPAWLGRRFVFVVFGAAFLYGLGAAIPKAVSKHLIELEKLEEARTRKREESDSGVPSTD